MRVTVLAGLFLFVLVASSEEFWRSRGFRPTVIDSPLRWSSCRADVYARDGKKSIAVVGTSRAQIGIVPEALEEELPGYRVTHLAIEATPPFETMRDLCEDPGFHGLLICEAQVRCLRPFDLEPEAGAPRLDHQYVAHYHHEYFSSSSYEKRLNEVVHSWLQSHFVILSPLLSFKSFVKNGLSPRPSYAHLRRDRYRSGAYRATLDPKQMEKLRETMLGRMLHHIRENLMEPRELETIARERIRPLHEALQARGGELIFLRMPTSGEYWEINERQTPKALLWDRLEEWSGAPAIHFLDYPELRGFHCPDGSHLDAEDAPEFTRRLARVIRRKLGME